MADITQILDAIQQGEPKAAGELLPLVYEELRKLAVVRMANEKPGQTLQPTALVHEVWAFVSVSFPWLGFSIPDSAFFCNSPRSMSENPYYKSLVLKDAPWTETFRRQARGEVTTYNDFFFGIQKEEA